MKIGDFNFSDDIPKKQTKAEFVKKFSRLAIFRRTNLGAVYDRIVKSGVKPKAEKTA